MNHTRVEYDEDESATVESVSSDAEARKALAARSRGLARAQARSGSRAGRFRYSWEDLAQALGKSPRTVQRWAREGRFDPRDFASVVRLLRREG